VGGTDDKPPRAFSECILTKVGTEEKGVFGGGTKTQYCQPNNSSDPKRTTMGGESEAANTSPRKEALGWIIKREKKKPR